MERCCLFQLSLLIVLVDATFPMYEYILGVSGWNGVAYFFALLFVLAGAWKERRSLLL
jgi:hypothetical protein